MAGSAPRRRRLRHVRRRAGDLAQDVESPGAVLLERRLIDRPTRPAAPHGIECARTDRPRHDQGLLSSIAFVGGEPAPCDALFFTTGQHPQCDLAVRLGCAFNSRGTVTTGSLSNTNVPGVFVAGDASRDAQFVVVAAAEGVKAAVAINQHLQKAEALP